MLDNADKLGHKAGDKVLKNFAEICAANVRASDFLARYGGEEFVLVLPETPLNHAHYVAEKLRGEIEGKGFCYNKRRVPITVSIGIAQFADLESVDVVFQRADRALYAAKNASRNRCVTETGLEGEAP
ncbi:MAG: GGDEF domain-containing protein [Gammaproteobacteria bacterium]